MLLSMTGYGKKELQNNDILISIELKSINSRYLVVNHKIPRLFSEDDDSILSVIYKKILRGKIIININYQILNVKLNNFHKLLVLYNLKIEVLILKKKI